MNRNSKGWSPSIRPPEFLRQMSAQHLWCRRALRRSRVGTPGDTLSDAPVEGTPPVVPGPVLPGTRCRTLPLRGRGLSFPGQYSRGHAVGRSRWGDAACRCRAGTPGDTLLDAPVEGTPPAAAGPVRPWRGRRAQEVEYRARGWES